MFRPITGKPNFPELEESILAFWNKQQIFKESVEQRSGGPRFTLYEGPPTVNASPGIHHVLSRVFKDIFPRYKSMRGFYAPRKAGWDTHGLPIELEVEEELGFSSKKDIEDHGIEKFNQKCRERVLQHIEEWNRLTERIGFWIDLDNPYKTLDNEYIESCWWAIKRLGHGKGLIYKGYRVTPHCPRCGTSLSSHEVAQGYQEDTPDPSVYILFRLGQQAQPPRNKSVLEKLGWDGSQWRDERPSFLVWTTTPWTLTANVALAINPDETYVLVQTRSQEGSERIILAEALVDKALGNGNYEIQQSFLGSELVGLYYERLFPGQEDFVVNGKELAPEGGKVFAADFVSMWEGTGIVHSAPAYGQEDYELGEQHGLSVVHTVDLGGHVKLPGGDWHGKFVKDADPFILDDLKSRGLLYRRETIKHTYPFCWRCDTPLIYYAKPSWYIKTTAKKDKLIEANDRINWYPEHIKRGRFGNWLGNNVDWAFSRERYWGTPLPVWQCPVCGHQEFIGSAGELKRLSGGYVPPDLHRPYVDRITLTCKECGGRMERVPDVIDCWFDSGAMPFAQWHYPFENGGLEENGDFPADYICEAVDQTRGWFYSLHALSVALFDQPCYRNVICLGHVLDANGEKMSKSRGNVIEPGEIIEKFGADALRWYLITSSPAGNVYRFAPEFVGDGLRRFLMTLWNTYSFFVTYANIDKFDPRKAKAPDQRPELDRWIISELNELIQEVTKSLDSYDATSAGRRIEGFVDDLSNWYIRRSRRRFWKSENDADKQSAHITLYECLTKLSKLLAPLIPFIAEEIYQNLVLSCYPDAPQSVHLADFPVSSSSEIDEKLSADTRLTMKVASLGRSARSKAGIKVRKPLAKAVAKVRANSETRSLRRLEHQILEELNVKELVITTDEKELVDFEIKPNLPLLGPKYGKELGQISAALSGLPQDEIASRVKAGKEVEVDGYILHPDEILVSTTSKPDYSVAEEGDYAAGVTTQVSQELADEGLVRELVHRLQTMRRSAGFDIADHIETYYKGGETVQRVMENFSAYVRQETLSKELIESAPPDGAYTEKHKVDGNEVILAIRR